MEDPTFVLGDGGVEDFMRLVAMAKPPYQLESASWIKHGRQFSG
jgi:hypothetical protein